MYSDCRGSKNYVGAFTMNVICVVGYPASGKGEFSNVAKEMGIPVIVMGDIIRKKTVEFGLELTDENVGSIARKLREELGREGIAILTVNEVSKIDASVVVIDGIRDDAEINYFKQRFTSFHVVYIKASFNIRFDRMQIRKRDDDALIPSNLVARDRREECFGLKRAIALADIVITNESDRETYLNEVHRVLRGLQ